MGGLTAANWAATGSNARFEHPGLRRHLRGGNGLVNQGWRFDNRDNSGGLENSGGRPLTDGNDDGDVIKPRARRVIKKAR